MKKVIIISERDFAKLATESNYIESAVSLAKDSIDNRECMEEIIKSIERHITMIQSVLNKEE